MRYKGLISNAIRTVREYRRDIDTLIIDFGKEKAKVENEIKENSDKWTDEYKQRYRSLQTPVKRYKEMIEFNQSRAKDRLEDEFKRIDKQIHSYFFANVRADFSGTLMSFNSLGVVLSDNELLALENNVQNYAEARLLRQYGSNIIKAETEAAKAEAEVNSNAAEKAYGTTATSHQIFTNDMLGRILNQSQLPTYDDVMKEYAAFKNNLFFVIDNYCGSKGEGYGILPGKEAIKTEKETIPMNLRGADKVEVASYEQNKIVDLAVAVNAFDLFTPTKHTEQDFTNILEKCNGILPDSVINTLSAEEERFIDARIGSAYDPNVKEKAAKLAKEDGYARELLSLDFRYLDVVKEIGYEE